MPEYMMRLWRSGRCPYLLPAAFYEEEGSLRCRFLTEGLTQMQPYAFSCPDGMEDSFFLLLSALESAAFAFGQLQLWLADPAYISLAPQTLYYDRYKQQSVLSFTIQGDSRPFSVRFQELCSGLGEGGKLIGERLQAFGAGLDLQEKQAAAFLRTWQQQIRG